MLTNCESDTYESKLGGPVTRNERHYVEQQIKLTNNNQLEGVGENQESKEASEGNCCLSSDSSWNPGKGELQQSSSESEHEIPYKKIKSDPDKKQKSKQKKPRGPSLKAEAVLPQGWLHSRVLKENAQYRNMLNKKQKNKKTPLPKKTGKTSKSPNNSTLKSNQPGDNENGNKKYDDILDIKIALGEVAMIRDMIKELKVLSNNLCTSLYGQNEELLQEKASISSSTLLEGATPENIPNKDIFDVKTEHKNISIAEILEKMTQRQSLTEIDQNVETPRKTNKPKQYTRKAKKRALPKKAIDDYRVDSNEMVPIGSGKTLVPKHMYDKIDWKSYTGATRKLLMAAFTRRTLATHSLTGKASPAFLHKPAKLCLDPKKVQDIVMTVTAHCHVKETLVRGAITTKCADENKMLKMQMQKTIQTAISEIPEDSKGDALQQETTPANPNPQ